MSTRSSDRAARAEARRRARMMARGEAPQHEEPEPDEAEPAQPGLLRRIFPPAPPLPDRPDPLAGFDADGPMRPLRERLFLLRSNLWAWLATGIVAFFGLSASIFYGASVVGMLATFVQFGALIAAGWIGWQRPTLYGATAGTISGVLTAVLVFIQFSELGASPGETFGPDVVVTQSLLTIVYQAAFGFLGGWYGGYLRRRQSHLSSTARRRR